MATLCLPSQLARPLDTCNNLCIYVRACSCFVLFYFSKVSRTHLSLSHSVLFYCILFYFYLFFRRFICSFFHVLHQVVISLSLMPNFISFFFVATVLVFTIYPASLASPALLRNHSPQFPEKTFFHRPFKVSLCMCSWCHALPTCSSSNFRINYSKHVLASVYCHECDWKVRPKSTSAFAPKYVW